MKIKKTTYNPKENLSREKLANPFSNDTIKERLINSKAIDLKNNTIWTEQNKGYFKSEIIDNSKYLK
jgi:lambda repressor-like predicted transcriptional regulator